MREWEAIGDVARRLVTTARDQREALARDECADDMSRMQPGPEEETRSMSERDGQRRGRAVDVLALRMERRGSV